MRIAVQDSPIFTRMDLEQGFATLHNCGFQGMDFSLGRWFNLKQLRPDETAVLDMPIEEVLRQAEPFRAAAQKHGIAFTQTHAPFPTWLPDNDPMNERLIAALQKSIAATAYLGAPCCVVHPAFQPDSKLRLSAQEEWELNRRRYTALIPALREHKVICCLENMFTAGPEGMRYAAVCSNFVEAAQWIDRLNDIAGEELFAFCFDTGHCHLTGQSMRYAINCLGKRIRVLHIHDNDGHTDWHVAPFMGTADWEGFVQGLRDVGYSHDLSFETFNVLRRYPAELTETALRSIAQTGAYFKARLEK